ncbi:MAG: rhomboid family intramembrane serine protease, partial [Geobacteraceae bacterium GWC2_48_7]
MEEIEGKYPEEWAVINACSINGAFADKPSNDRITLWALVLHARAIPCKIVQEGNGFMLLTQPEFLETAIKELRLFEEENCNWPLPSPSDPPQFVNLISTLSILLLLATFHNIVQLESNFLNFNRIEWISLGSANAGKIMNGEWWRTVTALTLHADSLHLVSNLLIGGLFVMLVCAELGSGPAWLLLLASGALGNFLNAVIHPPAHTSLGASTALFGAVGILAAFGITRYRRHLLRQRILPLAAALALLAILGTEGEKTDLGAHLLGFVSGLG